MPVDGDSSSPQELLNLAVEVYDLLQRKDATMGELLQIMEAKPGQEKSIEQTSDKVCTRASAAPQFT
jgi:hypothetical protein